MHILPYVNRQLGGSCCVIQGAQPSALGQPGGAGQGGWEGGS